ncbi:hypothetical protein [Chryseobacterium scophthalmum]|uniref:hypothetical protein n=1 Tax=Chryseobacterium scophthalmum TaxID=59733 RepID=UPI003D0785F0
MIEKDDPDYLIEEYKGRIIASHKNNVSQKSMDNIIIVYDKLDFPNYGFYIGLDDSKNIGLCFRVSSLIMGYSPEILPLKK